MVAKICPKCNSSDIDSDGARGEAVCTNCGHVLEECAIVSEVQFSENAGGQSSVVGQFVPENGVSSFRCGPGYGGFGKDSRELTLANGKRLIQHIAQVMHLGNDHIEVAHRFFQQAVQRNFIQGRKTHNVVAVCLYITCRFRKTSHMLIDFAENLQTDVYELGSVFLKFCKLLIIKLDPIDPSLYIHRFAGSLEFGDKTNAVATTAIRVVANMNREWMTTGRRPAGICGAGLLIAAKMHRFHRTEAQVAQVVRICDGTLKKRLNEFDETSASDMTVPQFNALFKTGSVSDFVDASTAKKEQENWAFTNACQPPALKHQEKKRKLKEQAAQRQAEQGDAADLVPLEELGNQANKILKESKALRDLDSHHEAGAQIAAAAQLKAAQLRDVQAAAASRSPPPPPPPPSPPPRVGQEQQSGRMHRAGNRDGGGGGGVVASVEAASAAAAVGTGLCATAAGASGAAGGGCGGVGSKGKEVDNSAPSKEARDSTPPGVVLQSVVIGGGQAGVEGGRRSPGAGGGQSEVDVGAGGKVLRQAEGEAGAGAKEEQERLSDVDDDEINSYIRTSEEAVMRETTWNELNRDYIEKQAEKQRMQHLKESTQPPGDKQARRKRRALDNTISRTAHEAASKMLRNRNLSNKVNYQALEELFGGD